MEDIYDAARQFFVRSPLKDYADVLASLLRPSICIQTHPGKGLSRSHFGGVPEAPPGFELPTWDMTLYLQQRIREYQALGTTPYLTQEIARLRQVIDQGAIAPLTYLGQIHLSELPQIPAQSSLPSTGVLYFFYDLENLTNHGPNAKQGWRCIYDDVSDDDLQAALNYNSDNYHQVFSHCSLSFQFVWMYSCPGYRIDEFNAYDMLREHRSVFERFYQEYEVTRPTYSLGTQHYLLGYPGVIQDPDMERDCQLGFCGVEGYATQSDEIEEGARDWQLLLQFDCDEDVGFSFGDTGRLYFWIREQELQVRDFSNVWCEFQSL